MPLIEIDNDTELQGNISTGGLIIGGVVGQRGAQGVGIQSITKTSTTDLVDTYTILFSNGTSTTFNVTNGDKGDKGDPGAIKFEIVAELPTSGIEEDTIYLVAITPDENDNNYEEYIYVNGAWELLGKIGVQVDLTGYVKNTDYAGIYAGVVKANQNGFKVSNTGVPSAQVMTASTYSSAGSNNFVSKGTLDNVLSNKEYEYKSNKVTSISGSSTDTDYPSAKCVYDSQTTQDTKITALENLTSGDSTIDGTGEYITLNNTTDGHLSLNLKGNTSQASTPTPSTPVDVNVVSGDNTIEICGKNLFDKDNANILNASFSDDGKKLTTSANAKTLYINCQPNTTYTVSKTGARFRLLTTVNTPAINVVGVDYTFNDGGSTLSITTSATVHYLCVYYFLNGTDTLTEQQILDSIQIEKSSTASTYEAYTGQSQLISLGSIELCKIGTYQDKIYKDNGIWYLHKEIGKKVITGTDSTLSRGGTNSQGYRWRVTLENPLPNTSASTTLPLYCDKLVAVTPGNTYNGVQGITIDTANNYSFFYITDTKNYSLDDMKAWLNTNNLTLYYILNNSTDTPIEDSTLISQLDTILYSYQNQTNISQVNNDKPFILDAEAFTNNLNGRIESLKYTLESISV